MDIRPFRAHRYSARVGPLGRVVSPPYDLYDEALQAAAYRRSAHHFVRLILSRDADPYGSAARTLEAWCAEGVLTPDPVPAIYPYAQYYSDPRGDQRVRHGLLALLRLTPLESGPVRPHERTLPRPLEDRLRLMRATAADLEPIFMIFPDRDGTIAEHVASGMRTAPAAEADDPEANHHRLWVVEDARWQERLSLLLEPLEGVIADGHHRYAAALRYAEERRREGADSDDPSQFKLAALFPAGAENLTVLPIHRVVESWPEKADVSRFYNASQMSLWRPEDVENAVSRTPGTLGVYARGSNPEMWALKPGATLAFEGTPSGAYKELPTATFEAAVLRGILGMTPEQIASQEGLRFVRNVREAKRLLWQNHARAFFLPPTPVEAIFATAGAGELMPQKSTFFYPKLLSGLAAYLHRA